MNIHIRALLVFIVAALFLGHGGVLAYGFGIKALILLPLLELFIVLVILAMYEIAPKFPEN